MKLSHDIYRKQHQMVSRVSINHAAEYNFSDHLKLFEEVEMRQPTGLEQFVFMCREVSS